MELSPTDIPIFGYPPLIYSKETTLQECYELKDLDQDFLNKYHKVEREDEMIKISFANGYKLDQFYKDKIEDLEYELNRLNQNNEPFFLKRRATLMRKSTTDERTSINFLKSQNVSISPVHEGSAKNLKNPDLAEKIKICLDSKGKDHTTLKIQREPFKFKPIIDLKKEQKIFKQIYSPRQYIEKESITVKAKRFINSFKTEASEPEKKGHSFQASYRQSNMTSNRNQATRQEGQSPSLLHQQINIQLPQKYQQKQNKRLSLRCVSSNRYSRILFDEDDTGASRKINTAKPQSPCEKANPEKINEINARLSLEGKNADQVQRIMANSIFSLENLSLKSKIERRNFNLTTSFKKNQMQFERSGGLNSPFNNTIQYSDPLLKEGLSTATTRTPLDSARQLSSFYQSLNQRTQEYKKQYRRKIECKSTGICD
ncbi:UNKNOWN [Stylonychia lemnae]|uniref:Uncharacterized protein n=1 Tax=Stylonychia lemnae TaxID=5949 RepID=A0A078B0D5_STYLE|nr:UNKNOWN [Stylonychia lemnae]|eukprot:CDW86553.1 UNKNOWN [Stylonychia lemnae]